MNEAIERVFFIFIVFIIVFKQTTNLLIRLCVAFYPVSEKFTGSRKIEKDSNLNPEKMKTSSTSKKKVIRQVTKIGVFGNQYTDNVEEIESVVEENYIPKYSYPKSYIESLMTNPYWLMVFLENVIERINTIPFKNYHEKDMQGVEV